MKPIVCIIAGVTAGVMLFAATVMAQGGPPAHPLSHRHRKGRSDAEARKRNSRLSASLDRRVRHDPDDHFQRHPVAPGRGLPELWQPPYDHPARLRVHRHDQTGTNRCCNRGETLALGRSRQRRSVRGGYRILAWRPPRRLELRCPGGAVRLGLDANHAHVRAPTTITHCTGDAAAWTADSPLIGWAADGYPVYAITGDLGNGVQRVRSSYRLKTEAARRG